VQNYTCRKLSNVQVKKITFAHLLSKADRNTMHTHTHTHTHIYIYRCLTGTFIQVLTNCIVRAALLWKSRSLASFLLRIPGNDPDVFHVRWVVKDVGRGRFLSDNFGFPCWVKFHQSSIFIFILVFSYQKGKWLKLRNIHTNLCSFRYREALNR